MRNEQKRRRGVRVNTRAAKRLAWSLWTVTIILVVGALVLCLANQLQVPFYGAWVECSLNSPTFATLGALIVSRRPGNFIGWIFLVASVASANQFLFGQYANVALASNGPTLPDGEVAAWLSDLMQDSFLLSVFFLIMLFPTGRLLSPRWRVVAWAAGLTIAASLISLAFKPGPLEPFASVKNPFGVQAAASVEFDAIVNWLSFACAAVAFASLATRFWHSRGEERLQIKWFVYATTIGFAATMLLAVFAPVACKGACGTLLWSVAFLGIPISAGIAILKYHLYDIDLVINHTLVYGSLTAVLAVAYEGGIVVLQYLFRVLSGQESQLAVVATTLLIAAMFEPLRRRIQHFVDRRFYRSKYDAAKTLETFSSRLRDETDLDALSEDLTGVVRATIEPAHLSLWLRPDTPPGESRWTSSRLYLPKHVEDDLGLTDD